MLRSIKKLVRNTFNLFNIDIHRIPEHEKNKFVWLKGFGIRTVMDIGANVGQFAIQTGKFLPDVKIYSFEPLEYVYNQLIEKTKNIKNFHAFNVALGDFNGTTTIKRNKFSPSSSLLDMGNLHKEAFPFTEETVDEKIIIRKLDDFIKDDNIEIKSEIMIKLDVQGYEDKVINGGKKTFMKAKVVITEVSFHELYKGQALFDEIYIMLQDLGFRYKGNINNSFHPQTGLPLFADAIFLK